MSPGHRRPAHPDKAGRRGAQAYSPLRSAPGGDAVCWLSGLGRRPGCAGPRRPQGRSSGRALHLDPGCGPSCRPPTTPAHLVRQRFGPSL